MAEGLQMYALRLVGPARFAEVEVPVPVGHLELDLVWVRLSAAGICGSDLPHFRAAGPRAGVGYPIHECVGKVVDLRGGQTATDSALTVGDRVVAMPVHKQGLAQIYLAPPDATHRVTCAALSDEQATLIQPLAAVHHAVSRLGDITGARAVVIGLGPIGLLAAHILRRRGVAHILGIDPADRGGLPALVGVDVVARPGREAGEVIQSGPAVDLCVEAVGHQTNTLDDAVRMTGPGGTILALGVPDSDDYMWPFRQFFRKNLTLRASVTPPWRPAMAAAESYLTQHLESLSGVITHTFDIKEAGRAFEVYAGQSGGRGKVVLTTESWSASAGP